jgi:hypothetical protein
MERDDENKTGIFYFYLYWSIWMQGNSHLSQLMEHESNPFRQLLIMRRDDDGAEKILR